MRAKKRKWGEHTISFENDNGHISWQYQPNDRGWGGYVSVDVQRDGWVTISTDDYEGTAMFPSAILPEVIKQLRAAQTGDGTQSER